MSNSEQLNNMANKILAAARSLKNDSNKKCNDNNKCTDSAHLNTSVLLTVVGLLSGSLAVESIFLNADQTFNIFLVGDLKALGPNNDTNKKNETDSLNETQKSDLQKNLDNICSQPFDEVIKAFINRKV